MPQYQRHKLSLVETKAYLELAKYLDELLERERNLENFNSLLTNKSDDLKLVESIIIKINGGLK